MSDFGKLNWSVSLKPTSAFPIDARCYFDSLVKAEAAAATAEEVGSTNTIYYYGQKLVVVENNVATWYTIQPDKTLKVDGSGNNGSGDMQKSEYDTDNNGKVDNADNAEKLGGQSPDYYANKDELPSKVSELENDEGYISIEKDPTVPIWAKEPNKPIYTAGEVGADSLGTAAKLVSAHNTETDAHNDIRILIQELTNRLNAVANSEDVNLDQLSEIVAYIKGNKNLIDGITTSKINYTDIINNLTTNVDNKPLSAAMGVTLKALIDEIVIPVKVSELENDAGYLTQHQDLSAYAKKTEIPTVPTKISQLTNDKTFLTKSEIEALIESIVLNGYLGGKQIRYVDDENDSGKEGYLTIKKG